MKKLKFYHNAKLLLPTNTSSFHSLSDGSLGSCTSTGGRWGRRCNKKRIHSSHLSNFKTAGRRWRRCHLAKSLLPILWWGRWWYRRWWILLLLLLPWRRLHSSRILLPRGCAGLGSLHRWQWWHAAWLHRIHVPRQSRLSLAAGWWWWRCRHYIRRWRDTHGCCRCRHGRGSGAVSRSLPGPDAWWSLGSHVAWDGHRPTRHGHPAGMGQGGHHAGCVVEAGWRHPSWSHASHTLVLLLMLLLLLPRWVECHRVWRHLILEHRVGVSVHGGCWSRRC